MSDGFVTNQPTTSGKTFASRSDGTWDWPSGLVAWGPVHGPYNEVDSASGKGLPVQPSAGAIFTVTSTGNVASGAADSGNPVKVGGVYHSAGVTLTDGQRGDLQLDSAGRLLVSPLSNVLVRAAQQGGWTVTLDADASVTPGAAPANSVLVAVVYNATPPAPANGQAFAMQADAAGNLKVSAASLPLPAGAATAANQSTANTTLTAVSANTGNVAACANNDYDNHSTKVLAVAGYQVSKSAFRSLRATDDVPSGGEVGLVVRNIPSGTQDVNAAKVNGTTTSANTGNADAGTQRVVIASNQPAVAVTGTFWQATQPVSGTVTANAGTNLNTSALALESGGNLASLVTVEGATADAIVAAGAAGSISAKLRRATQGLEDLKSLIVLAAGTNLVGKVGIDQTTPGTTNAVTPVPATSGGWSVSRVKSAASTNATLIKASAGQIGGWFLFNNTASAKFVKFFNLAVAPTVGTSTVLFTVPVPANGGTNVPWDMGIPCNTGLAYAITGAIGDSDTTSTAADDVHGFILWK